MFHQQSADGICRYNLHSIHVVSMISVSINTLLVEPDSVSRVLVASCTWSYHLWHLWKEPMANVILTLLLAYR